ncbi:unnamed protein product [Gulo gulo]|jgi:hypothetical protein
MSAF